MFGIMIAAAALSSTPTAQPLFVDTRAGGGERYSPATVAQHEVDLAAGLLDADSLRIDLPTGTSLVARRTREFRHGEAGRSWVGSSPDGDVVIARRGDAVAGLIYAGGEAWELLGVEGRATLARLDQAQFPECAGTLEALAPRAGAISSSSSCTPPWCNPGDQNRARRPVSVPDPGSRVPGPGSLVAVPRPPSRSELGATPRADVMVLYTAQAQAGAGGQAQVEALAQAAVDLTNVAYVNSEIDLELALVHVGLATRSDTGDISSDLGWLAGDADVAAQRDAVGADLTALLVNDGGGSCGVGYVQRNPGPGFASSAFQVTVRGCAVGNLSLAHEFGHNMGAEHNPENASVWPNGGSYPWSFGHWHNGIYRTVMSYQSPCGACTRHPYFSNAAVSFQNLPTGVADLRENARTLGATAIYVTNFRPTLLFGDGFETGDTSAWSVP
jgi:hypothetical protein